MNNIKYQNLVIFSVHFQNSIFKEHLLMDSSLFYCSDSFLSPLSQRGFVHAKISTKLKKTEHKPAGLY